MSPSAFLCVPLLQSSDSVPYIVVCLFTVPGVHAGWRRGASLRAVYTPASGACVYGGKSGIHTSVSVSYWDLEARLEPLGGRGDDGG